MIEQILAVGISAGGLDIPTFKADDVTFRSIVNLVYVAVGAVAVFYIVRGALLFVTSQGDPNDIKQARTTILIAVMSLVLVSIVFALINFFIANVGGK